MKIDYKKIMDDVFSINFWSRLAIVTISIFVLAINYNIFLLHNNLVVGGASGLATIFYFYLGINPATFLFIFNIVFIILSFIFLGPKMTGLTIFGSILYPLFISLTAAPCEQIANSLAFDDFILIPLISGVLFGIADGFIFKNGYSTGGADIIIQLCSKYMKIPHGTASFIVSGLIVGTGAIAFGLNKAIYAIIVIAINSVLVDKIMLGISDSKMFYIHTKKPEEIKSFLDELETGYTIMKADGGHTNKKSDLIMCVISTKDYYMFKNVITKIDADAFFIISDCYEVYGGKRKNKFLSF